MPVSFQERKRKILQDLGVPDEEYQDLSPKGSVDEGIRELIGVINGLPDYVTTSSCAGRIAVYQEGAKGAKGGGQWLFTSHEPITVPQQADEETLLSKFSLPNEPASAPPDSEGVRFIHFKSEPMVGHSLLLIYFARALHTSSLLAPCSCHSPSQILHILTSSLPAAHHASSAALQAGFRESGINGVLEAKDGSPATPMVAVRSSGLAFDCIIGYCQSSSEPGGSEARVRPMVSEEYLRTLVGVANQRFRTNSERRERFREALVKEPKAKR